MANIGSLGFKIVGEFITAMASFHNGYSVSSENNLNSFVSFYDRPLYLSLVYLVMTCLLALIQSIWDCLLL